MSQPQGILPQQAQPLPGQQGQQPGQPRPAAVQQKPKNPVAIAIAEYLRNHSLLKQRSGLNSVDGTNVDFFRYKRCIRALLSDDYKKLQAKSTKVKLPPVADTQQAQQIFIMLIQSQLIIPVTKLHSVQAKVKGLKIKKDSPYLEPIKKAVLQDNEYFVWNFQKSNPFLILYSILGLIAVFALILFPLWPFWMRKGVWYLSTGLLCLIGLFFVVAFIRLIIYGFTLVLSNQFWLFPNLFEDCGFFESFQPLYAWTDGKTQSKSTKSKKSKASSSSTTTTTNSVPQSTATTTQSKTPANSSATKRVVRSATIEELE